MPTVYFCSPTNSTFLRHVAKSQFVIINLVVQVADKKSHPGLTGADGEPPMDRAVEKIKKRKRTNFFNQQKSENSNEYRSQTKL